jgi:hypothetical protein
MRIFLFALLAAAWAAGTAPVRAETLGDPKIGFTAMRVLVFDGTRYVGRMWARPGEQRHEQSLSPLDPVFILRADSHVADVLLPKLHTAVELELPAALAALGEPAALGPESGTETVNGVKTVKYAVDRTIPAGHLAGALWLSHDGVPMRCDGTFTSRKGKVSTVHWELRDVAFGEQDARLFEVPAGYSILPPEAAATLLGLRLASHPKH